MCHKRWALHIVIKRKVCYIYICSFSTIFYAISISDICLKSSKSISIPNFDELSQSMAKINYSPVWENGRPPCWNFISGFDFDICVVIGMSFGIGLPHFVKIELPSAKLWHVQFSRWRPAAILDLMWVTLDHPWRVIVGLCFVVKFDLGPIYSCGDMVIFIFQHFGLNLPIPAHFGGVFWGIFPQNMTTHRSSPQKECGSSVNPFLRRLFPFLPDWLHGLSDHAQRLYG